MECPECFYKISKEEKTCPQCGAVISDPDSPRYNAWQKAKKRAAVFRRVIQVLVGLIVLAGCILGKVYGGWWWLAGAFGIGLVFAIIVFFIVEIVVHFKTVLPYQDIIKRCEEENSEKE